jgi:hypothetical protein
MNISIVGINIHTVHRIFHSNTFGKLASSILINIK